VAAGSPGGWGWHRLDAEWARRLVDAAGVRPGELVLDLGAGAGSLTEPLLAAGARVVAVELHPRRAVLLRRRFGADLIVVCADALTVPLPSRPFRVVANPPFGMTGPLVDRLVRADMLTSADLVLQRSAARRLAERLDRRGWRAEVGLPVPRRAFTPRPVVDASVLVLRRRLPRRRPPRRR
jgi:23S rRNA (adenine-N6)-dimethyltransferase